MVPEKVGSLILEAITYFFMQNFITFHFILVPQPQSSQKRQGSGVTSPNSTRSSNSNSAKSPSSGRSPANGKSASGARSPPTNAARTPEFKMANQKKLRGMWYMVVTSFSI